MKKEHFKNFVLILLIITNFMLSQRIFANKKLWLFGYNFFANMGNNLTKEDYFTSLHIAVPEKIFVNTGYQSNRYDFLRSSDEFDNIYKQIQETVKAAFESPIRSISEISREAWNSVLSGKSIYLSYGGEFSAEAYARLLDISQTNIPSITFSHLVISEDGNVLIKDNLNDKYYRIVTRNSAIADIIELVMTQKNGAESIVNYSYELNFDKDFGDQKTFISHMVPVYSSPVSYPTLFADNPIIKGSDINDGVVGRILSAFSINPNTVRRYTEADGTMVFVENNGILRISTEGVLSFTANDTGIELSGGRTNLDSLARFVDSINQSAGSQKDMAVTSSVSSDSTSFSFDYLVGGVPVRFDDSNAVSAVIENGYLKEYTHILRKYTQISDEASSLSFIESLDETILSYQDSMKEIHIMEMYPAYNDKPEYSEISQGWYIEINDVIIG